MYMNYIQFRYTTVIYVQIFGQRRRILDIPGALGRFYGMPASGLNQLYRFLKFLRGHFDFYDFLRLRPLVQLALSYRSMYRPPVYNIYLPDLYRSNKIGNFGHLEPNADIHEDPFFLEPPIVSVTYIVLL